MPKIPQPGPPASIVVPTNNLAALLPPPVYPFAALPKPSISNPAHFLQTELMLKSDSPSGFFRSTLSQGVLGEQSHSHVRPQWS